MHVSNTCFEPFFDILDYFKAYKFFFPFLRWIAWRSKNVINAMEESLVAKYPPKRMLVGMDAKYVFAPLNYLPTGFGIPSVRVRPAFLKD